MLEPGSGMLTIKTEHDIVNCRKAVRELTTAMGFGLTDITRIVTSVSELARNVYVHAGQGEMLWKALQQFEKIGIELIFIDQGPGIADVNQAIQPGFSTANSMGMGLPGVKRLMDEIEIKSTLNAGTTVIVKKWAKVRN